MIAKFNEVEAHELAHTGATPKTRAASVTKNISPTYSPEILGRDFNWLEILEWMEGGSLATNTFIQLKSKLSVFGEYVGLVFLAKPPDVALVMIEVCILLNW